MKLIVEKKKLPQPPEIWLRSAGYTFIPNDKEGGVSFARRLTRDFYPRFHIYFTEAEDESGAEQVTFNLHLDQKRPGYEGQNRHNAEYDGAAVETEAARLKGLVLPEIFV